MTESVFYIFASLLIISSICVVSLKNAVHAALWLIFSFFNAAGLFLFIGAEYIAMTLVIVYVGAVAVLFLFVIMMLDIKPEKIKSGAREHIPLVLFLSAVIFLELQWAIHESENYFIKVPSAIESTSLTNAEMIGRQLYTKYFLQFQIAGFILLAAIVGSIMVTIRHSKFVRKQNIYKQLIRRKEDCIELIDQKMGGVNL